MNLWGKVAIVVAVLLAASVFPTVDAAADVDIDVSRRDADIYYEWAVATDVRAPETVVLTRFDGTSWVEVATATPAVPAAGFGASVAVGRGIDRTQPVVVVGAPDSDQVFIYGWDGFGLTELNVIAGDPGSAFGASVDAAAGRILVGAPRANGGQGTSVLFDNAGGFLAELSEPAADPDAGVGTVVQLESARAYVGAPGQEFGIGAVFRFDVPSGLLAETIKPNAPIADMRFGTSLSSDPGRVLIGGLGQTSMWLQQGVNQIEIASPTGAVIRDVGLEGNLAAAVGTDRNVAVLTDNGATGFWASYTNLTAVGITPEQVALGGGHVLATGIDEGLGGGTDPLPIRSFIDDLDPQKILPSLGRQETQFGNRVDIDGDTMAAIRSTGANPAQIVVSKFNGFDWITEQYIDLTSAASGGVAIQGDLLAVAVADRGDPANPHVVVFQRADVASPFVEVAALRTQSSTSPRGIAIDETGQFLAVGVPNPGQVELFTGGPTGWVLNAPQVLTPQDTAGTGAATFGWDLDFGDDFLLIGSPGSTSLQAPAAFPGVAEQWSLDEAGVASYFVDVVPVNSAAGDFAGWTVEIEPGLRAVGSPGLGTVQVYRSGLTDSLLSDPSPGPGVAYWGYAVDLDDGVLAVTDWLGDTIAYDLHSDLIAVLGSFQPTDLEQSDFAFQTFPLATSGGKILTGARLEDWQGRDAGAIYTFSVTPSPPPVFPRDWLPVVDIDATYAVVGNPAQDLVHVLRNDGAGWVEVQQLVGVANTSFGAGVALDGDRLVVGAPDANGNVGEATVFARGSDGAYTASLVLPGSSTADDEYGAHLDIVGDFVIAGRPLETGGGSAIIINHRTGAESATFVASDQGYGSAVSISNIATTGTTQYLAFVGAPDEPNNLGFVQYFAFDGTSWNSGALVPSTATIPGYGTSVDANGLQVAVNAPNQNSIEVWEFDPATGQPVGGAATVLPVTSTTGEVALSGDVLAVGAPDSSEIHLWSDNGSSGTFQQTLILASGATGRSLAIDGQWMIAATDAASTDWTQLATLSDLTVVAPHPNEPAGKSTIDFATDDLAYGSTVAVSDDTLVVAGQGSYFGSAISELVVIDRASGVVIQRITPVTLGSDDAFTSADISGNRLAYVRGESVVIAERAAPGLPFDTVVASIGANAVSDVDIDGDLLVFGQTRGFGGLDNPGHARLFEFDGISWVEDPASPLVPGLGISTDGSVGSAVAVEGNVVVVGADFSNGPGELGRLYVWARPDAASPFVEQPAFLTGTEGTLAFADGVGSTLAYDGTHLVAGAPFEDRNGGGSGEPGVLYVWTHLGNGNFDGPVLLDPRGTLGGDDANARFGFDVALSDGIIVAGAPGWTGTATEQGAVISYVLDTESGLWNPTGFVEGQGLATDAEPGDRLGTSVDIAGTAVVAGAAGEDANGADAGATYSFTAQPFVAPPPVDGKLVSPAGSDLTDAEVGDLFGYDMDTDGNRLVIGAAEAVGLPAPLGDPGSGGQGGVYVFGRGVDGWDFEQFIENPGAIDPLASEFGLSVAIDGDTLVVGAPATGNNSQGTAWVFDLNNPTVPVEIQAAGISTSARYGTSVDVEGTTVVVGADAEDFDPVGAVSANSGAAFVWQLGPGGWEQIFTARGTNAGDQYGVSVDLDGGNLAVGTLGNNAGYVDVWRPDGAGGYVADPRIDGASSVQFGVDLDLQGDRMVVGAANGPEAFVYEWNGTTWGDGFRLVPSGPNFSDFGQSVAIDGTVVVVGEWGADFDAQDQGRVHVFGNTAVGEWTQIAEFVAPDAGELDGLGWSVEVVGGEILAGAPFDDNANGIDAGAVYEFAVTPPNPPEPEVPGKLVSEPGADLTDAEVGDLFGYAVDSDGTRLVIGAPELPVGGTGGVFVYRRVGDVWTVESYIENPDAAAAGSQFGAAVAVDGNTLVVGAPDAGAAGEGTAWIIDLSDGSSIEIPSPDEVDRGFGAFYGTSVDVEGSIAVVGAPGYDFTTPDNDNESDAGKVYVWENDGAGTWSNSFQIGTFSELSFVGQSVALDGEVLALGAPSNFGFVEVWRRAAPGDWQQDVVDPAPSARLDFGYSVDISGSNLIVGAPGSDEVTLYRFDGTSWTDAQLLPQPTAVTGTNYGWSVAIDGTVAVIGEPDDGSGQLHVWGNTDIGEWTLLTDSFAVDGLDGDRLGFAVDVVGGEIVAGAPFDDNPNGVDAGGAYTLSVVAPEIPIDGKFIAVPGSDPTDGEAEDLFGSAAVTDGQRLVIAAPENDNTGRTGGVHVYDRIGDEWVFDRYLANPDPTHTDSSFGLALAVQGDTLVVGSPFADTAAGINAGTVWVYDLATTDPPVELPAPVARGNHFYGISLDLDGDVLAVGARGNADDGAGGLIAFAGELHVFERDAGGAWVSTLIRAGQASPDQYTAGLAVSGDRIAVGAIDADGAGYVDVLERTGPGQWMVQDTFTGTSTGDQFGFGLDLDGNNLAIAAPGVPAVTMYTFHDGAWDDGVVFSSIGEVENPTPIRLDGTVVVVGDPFDDLALSNEGSATVYGNTGWLEWTELASFDNPDAERSDFFGSAVTVSGGNIVIGARSDDNSNGTNAGAAYVRTVVPPLAPQPPDPPVDPTVLTELTYVLPTSVMPGATSVTVEGAAVAASSEGAATGGGIVAASISAIDVTSPEVEQTWGRLTLADLGIDTDAPGVETLLNTPLSEIPIEGGWGPYIPADKAGYPLQAITLGDVLSQENVPETIPLRFVDLQQSPLRFVDIAAVAYGEVAISTIDLDGDPATPPLDDWCNEIAAQGTSCAELAIDSTTTLGTVSAAGVNLEATPLRFVPLRFVDLEATPLRFVPLRFVDIEASPLRFVPLRFVDIEASPLRFVPLRFVPLRFVPLRFVPLRFVDVGATPLRFVPLRFVDIEATPLRFVPLRFVPVASRPSVVDCALVDCETANFGDAVDAGALLDGFTLNDLGDDVVGELRFDDILDALDETSRNQLLADHQRISDELGERLAEFSVLADGLLGQTTLGDLDPAVFDELAALGEFFIGDFLATVDPEVLEGFTLNDFLLLFMPRESYEWNDVDLGAVNLQLAGMQAPLTAAITFTTSDGPPEDDVTLIIDLPAGAVAQENTFALAPTGASIDSVSVTETTATIQVSGVASGAQQLLTFGFYQGLDLGSSTSVVSASVDLSNAISADTISVVEAFEPDNDNLAGAVPVIADTLYVSHLGGNGDADFYRLTVTEPSTAVSVQLANLAADYDLVVYGPRLASIIPTDDNAAASAPTADFDSSGSGSPLSPTPLNDLPNSLEELQIYGASYFRGTQAEQVDFLAIEAGDYFVQVTGYLGASSPKPYSLRAATTPTVELACPQRSFAFTGSTPGANTSAPGADTLVLVNRSRFESLYGPTETAAMLTALDEMIAAAAANGIGASVIDLDAFANVQAAYDAWDASPCSTVAVNNVVGAISNEILAIRSTQQIDNILLIGGDDVVPFARVKDATSIANEQSYTNTFTATEDNALRSAFAGSWVLTDDPYADQAATPVANTDRVVYVPEVAMGRLVETPTEIIGSLQHYADFNGQLDPSTGFVAGYDFLDDGAELTGDNLEQAVSPGAVQRLINETWTAAELEAGLAAEPDTALVAAHFDHFNALPAASSAAGVVSDLFDVTDASALNFDGSIIFSVGCHGGLSVSDLLIAPSGVVSQDWAQTFLGGGAAAFVGNTGYGYGDDTAVALSEKLMADFAAGLGEYETIGEALLYAKQEYAADLTVYGAFDEKALMEATLYGIPFYRLGNAVVPEPVPDPPTAPAPTGGQAYTDTFDPVIEVTGDGTEDEVWSTPGENGEDQVQVTNGYPILPRFEWEVTQQDPGNSQQLELEARGVVLEALTTRDEIDVDPATARAVYDLAANEPNIDSPDVTFALSPAISTYLTPEGIRQDVNMTVGAFQSTEPDGSGTMRLFEQFEATVYYADNPDAEATKPIITDVQANAGGGTLNLAVDVWDESEIVRVMALVTPTPLPNLTTEWSLLELSDAGGGTWQGDLALAGDSVQWLIMAVDTHGNTAWSMSKQLAFDGGNDGGFAPALLNPVAPAEPVLVGETVELSADLWDFDGSDDPISVSWDFGDGSGCAVGSGGTCDLVAPTDADPLGSTSASHSYAEPGVYTVTAIATDSTGRSDTLVLGPVVVVSETTQGAVVANGRARAIGDDDIVPDGLGRRQIKVNITAGYGNDFVDSFNVRFTADGVFDLRGTSFDYVDVVGDTALVIGPGILDPDTPDEQAVVYSVFVDDATNRVTLSVWTEGSDPSTTTPLYRITVRLSKRTAVKVFD